MNWTSRALCVAVAAGLTGISVSASEPSTGAQPWVMGPPLPSESRQVAPESVLGPPRPSDAANAPSASPSTSPGFALTPFGHVNREPQPTDGLLEMMPQTFSLKVDNPDLLIGSTVMKRVANPSTGQAATEHPIYLAEGAMEAETPNIHGFIEVPFKTAYVTPRGLVVENAGLVIQPVGGIVFPVGDLGPMKNFTFVTGIWNSINTAQGDTNVGPWNEMDYFASFSWAFAGLDNVSFNLTYGAWNFPQSTELKPSTEHNIDLKISYDDSKMWGDSGFALNPYADLWWAVAGSSTVVLGDEGDTGYVELGVVPTFTVTPTPDMPIKLAFPTYFSVGPASYWDSTESGTSFGVASTSVNATIPLNFIPTRLGYWHATAGVSYFYLLNGTLLDAGTLLSGNDNRHVIVGSLGIGVNF